MSLAIPASVEATFQMALGFIDQLVIANLGERSLAAVGLMNSLMFVTSLVLGGIGSGAAILVARHRGAGEDAAVSWSIASAVQIAALVTLPLAALGAALPQTVLGLLGATAPVADTGAPFVRMIALSLPVSVIGSVLVGSLRSLGDTRTPMLITLAIVVLNTGLNLVLVYGAGPIPALGVAGAGVATLIAQLARLAAILWRLGARRDVHVRVAHWFALRRPQLAALVTLSAPIALTQIMWATGNLSYTVMGARLGTSAVAATNMINATEGLFIMLSSGLSVAAMTVVGHALGAGSAIAAQGRAWRVIQLGLASSLVFGLALAATSHWIAAFYPAMPAATLQLAALGLVLNAVFQPAKVLNMILGNGVLPAGGDTRFILVADTTSVFAFGIPLALGLGFGAGLGLLGVIIARVTEEVVKLMLFVLRYRSRRWLHRLAPEVAA